MGHEKVVQYLVEQREIDINIGVGRLRREEKSAQGTVKTIGKI